MTKDEALDLALEALESWAKGFPDLVEDLDKQAITAIKQALAAPVQEPVAWPIDEDVAKRIAEKQFVSYEVVQLIAREILATPPAAQRQFVGLTDEEILAANYPDGEENGPTISAPNFELDCFAKQVEAKLRSKNNG
jgi:hypothetical protein